MGKEVGEREFWQLLRAPDTPLLEGKSGGHPPLDISPDQDHGLGRDAYYITGSAAAPSLGADIVG